MAEPHGDRGSFQDLAGCQNQRWRGKVWTLRGVSRSKKQKPEAVIQPEPQLCDVHPIPTPHCLQDTAPWAEEANLVRKEEGGPEEGPSNCEQLEGAPVTRGPFLGPLVSGEEVVCT